jgi:hypothetical protein
MERRPRDFRAVQYVPSLRQYVMLGFWDQLPYSRVGHRREYTNQRDSYDTPPLRYSYYTGWYRFSYDPTVRPHLWEASDLHDWTLPEPDNVAEPDVNGGISSSPANDNGSGPANDSGPEPKSQTDPDGANSGRPDSKYGNDFGNQTSHDAGGHTSHNPKTRGYLGSLPSFLHGLIYLLTRPTQIRTMKPW